ncbi:lysosome-associated membrane glycoprotein 1a [Aplochiton taeniatus]
MTHRHPPCTVVAWFAILGCAVLAQAVTFEVKQGNSTCIKAELSASLSITYDTASGKSTAQVSLPDSAEVDVASSSCGSDSRSPWLVVVFGVGHSLGLGFSTNGVLYSVANLTLQYNLSDIALFPGANSSDVVTVVTSSVGMVATVNTTYRCFSSTSVLVDGSTVTFTDMKLEAYMPGNDLSPKSVCTADMSVTTPVPTPPVPTTAAPAPSPVPPGPPERGEYIVNNDNKTACLLANMGLQLNVSYLSVSQNKTEQRLLNLQPNQTTHAGSCGLTSATLVLSQEGTMNLTFTFSLASKLCKVWVRVRVRNSTSNKYHLSGLALSAVWPDMAAPDTLVVSNSSLEYLRSTLGRSYMCSSEQSLAVADAFSLNTFRLQVQPFAVTSNQFASAEECQLDQDNMLIPIIVGAALAGLVLIVLVAYLIGRKRSHAGYQTI